MEWCPLSPPLFTVGHSNRELVEFLSLLQAHRIDGLIDVRSHPISRRFPHFSEANLRGALRRNGLDYEHWPEFGGYREPRDPSENTALTGGFRAVADFLNQPGGRAALHRLSRRIRRGDERVVLMCAERDPRDCHRRVIADHCSCRGATVQHLIGRDEVRNHRLHDYARVSGDRVTYPGIL